jgi:hypothetical protein
MTAKVIDKNIVVISQTYMDDDTELNGEQALIIQEWEGSGLVAISQDDQEIKINYDSIEAVIKTLKAMLVDKSLFEVKY